MIIQGTVAPGYESVKALYEHNMHHLAERNTQLCIYVGDECVVDLWGSAIDDPGFSPDSLVNVFSSGKSLEAILLAMLVDRGLLSYDAPLTEYWPEFGANGKTAVTVADLMRHEAGLAAFDVTLEPQNLHPEQLRNNSVGVVIQNQAQKFREGANNQREYHAITRGWIANEVFRRVEPDGRTMGQFLRDEVSTPLQADVYINLLEDDLPRINDVHMLGFGYQFWQGLVPKRLGRKMELNLAQTIAKLARLRAGFANRTTAKAPVPIAGMQKIAVVNSPAVAKGEIPSAGSKCSARGLAKLAAVMANGGQLGEYRIMSDSAYAALHDEPVARAMLSLETSFTQGGVAEFQSTQPNADPIAKGLNNGREGFFGWMGLGGSIFQWHPEQKIGFAYVPTSLNVLDLVNERGKAYQAEVKRCVEALAGQG
ncbi:MAG: serine hydrolase domain-containing protein [Pseudomonadota bacterium]